MYTHLSGALLLIVVCIVSSRCLAEDAMASESDSSETEEMGEDANDPPFERALSSGHRDWIAQASEFLFQEPGVGAFFARDKRFNRLRERYRSLHNDRDEWRAYGKLLLQHLKTYLEQLNEAELRDLKERFLEFQMRWSPRYPS